ncbi:MAG: TerD family protein [Bacteroidales bacterium]|jgi:tellurium resistance protein TerD|nr:TerD family protein [Bacteroidales bacterium]
MAINLTKGQRIEIGLSKVGVGLGWDPNEGTGFDFDLDASAFMLGANKKLPQDEFFVFYNSELRVSPENLTKFEPQNPSKYPPYYDDEEGKQVTSIEHWRKKTRPISPDFSVCGSFDDTSGSESDGGDDETINVDLSKVDSTIQEIIFTVTIHDYEARKQNFGQVRNSYVRIFNDVTGEEIAKYELDEDFSIETAVEFGRLYKRSGEWKFEAMGIGYKGGLQYFVDKYA